MKVKVRVVTIQDKDEIIENQANIIVDLKMKLSALEGEYGMVSRHNKYLKTEIEKLHRSEENNIGLQASMKDLCSRYDKLSSDYDDLKKTYEETKEKDAKYAFEMGQNLGQMNIDYGVLKGEYDHLKAEFNELYSQHLSYMDKIQKFITDIKG